MASIYSRKESPYFYMRTKNPHSLQWEHKKLPVRIADPDAKRKCAMLLAKEHLREAALMPVGEKKLTGWGWVPAFIGSHYENALSRQRALNAWAALQVFIVDKRLDGPEMVKFAHGRMYVDWRQRPPAGTVKARSKNTALLEVKIWSVIMQHAVEQELALANPLFRLGIKREKAKLKPEITLEQQAAIEAALGDAPGWMADAWAVAMLQGCRLRQTACPLDRIDLERDIIRLPAQKGKEHTMPLHSALRALVAKRQAEKATLLVEMPKAPSKHWRNFFDRIGLKEISFHSTRVTVNTRLLRAGFSTAQVMATVGHSREQTNIIYRRLSPADVKVPLETLSVGV